MRGQSLCAIRMDLSCCTSDLNMSTSCCNMLFIISMSLDFLSRFSTHTFFFALHLLAAALWEDAYHHGNILHHHHTNLLRSKNFCLLTSGSSSSGFLPRLRCSKGEWLDQMGWLLGTSFHYCSSPGAYWRTGRRGLEYSHQRDGRHHWAVWRQ